MNPDDGADLWSASFSDSGTDGAVKGFVWADGARLYYSTTNTVWALTDGGGDASEDWRITAIPYPSTLLRAIGTPYLLVVVE